MTGLIFFCYNQPCSMHPCIFTRTKPPHYYKVIIIIHMSSPEKFIRINGGLPVPGGVAKLQDGTNFSIFARHATRVTLVIDYFSIQKQEVKRVEFHLDPHENRTGDMWHVMLSTPLQEFSYGYRIDGEYAPESMGHCYDYSKILIDPYSTALAPRAWGQSSEYGLKPCSRVTRSSFDWQNDRPLKTPLSDTIIYEMHVRGFTRHASANVGYPGTYAAVIEKIPYLKELGVTAVELMPITEFDENDTVFHDPETGERLKNFWGYNPVSFFAINSGYARDPQKAIDEFKGMVLALHKAGIEVFLDLVYNHTGEGGCDGTTSSFRGIDNCVYYLLDDNHQYLNYSGCGNTMNCNHPVVRDLIRESLRYWVVEMHIDGFRFDLASILGRDRKGNVLANPPVIERIVEDPVLRDTKLIAEAWDAAGLYQVGTFSSDPRWAEWNGRYRDDIRSFMLGGKDTVSNLATRIAGSSDLYQSSGRTPLCSINFLTSHDGFTLYDLVSYNTKNNTMNGEDNRDGDNHNISWNSGVEGHTASKEIQELRMRRIKTMLTILFVSQGVPMLSAGDEFARTQRGNNNAWCQDNEISWLDWSFLEKNRGLFRFVRKVIALRKKHGTFRRNDFFLKSDQDWAEKPDIIWQYLEPGQQNWEPDCNGLAFYLRGMPQVDSCDFFVMLNGGPDETLRFTVPPPRDPDTTWKKLIDTGAREPYDFLEKKGQGILPADSTIAVKPFGCVVLQTVAPAPRVKSFFAG